MVRYNQAYKGSTHIGYIYKNGKVVKKIYKGSELVYQLGFDPITYQAGTSLQTFTVPLGVSKIHVDCVGSKGQDVTEGALGGKGGRVQCDLAVNGGETLYITVGAIPTSGATATYNASDIRLGGTDYGNRIIVAGGGGSSSYSSHYGDFKTNGGDGGGLTGGSGTTALRWGYSATEGTGGTQTGGGTGATAATPYTRQFVGGTGTFGLGGNGDTYTGIAGAGGAGYYGGGGGASSAFADEKTLANAAGGAGGGSSYTNASCSNVVHTQGYNDGAGYVTISFVE